MKVSVLVTTYNHEKYVEQALDSALMQQTHFDYEIIIAEDFSADRTRSIVADFQRRDPDKIRLVLPAKNLGCHGNRVFAQAFELAQGQYVALLDGDDYWISPTKLQKEADFLDAHPECALCFHNAIRIYEDSSRAALPYNFASQQQICDLEDIWEHNFIAGCTPMVRKNVLRTFPEWYYNLHYGDWSLYILCALHGKIGYIDEILGVYRIHSRGFWSKLNAIEKLEGLIAFYEAMNANLGFRFDHIVGPLVSARRKQLASLRSLVETAQKILPTGAVVIATSKAHEDLPPLKGHRVWAFPDRSVKQTRQHFASGSSGSAEAPWIQSNRAYEFRLYRAASDELLASVTVVHAQTLVASPASNQKPGKKGAFIEASPNPVSDDIKPGKTTIRWNTGDGSMGVVQVVMTDLQMRYPADATEAIKQLETVRTKGGQFFLVPHAAFTFFERYPELKQYLDRRYRLVEDNEFCQIYDLRESPSENQRGRIGTHV